MNTGATLTADAAVSLSSAGAFDFLRDARWHRGTMACVGDWEAVAFDVEVAEAGLE